jgi:hypothetical protein
MRSSLPFMEKISQRGHTHPSEILQPAVRQQSCPANLPFPPRASGGVRDNVVYTTESQLVYPAGRHLAVYNFESKEMRFILQAHAHRTLYLALQHVPAVGARAAHVHSQDRFCSLDARTPHQCTPHQSSGMRRTDRRYFFALFPFPEL